jgi:peptidoglycan/LPS O-acetylase OafA/YrhL
MVRLPRFVGEDRAEASRGREIDWLRGYAILFVVLEHATLVMPYPTFWSDIVHVWFEGRTGVDLFFVISGYVIAKSFVRDFDRALDEGARSAWRLAIAFYLKRIVRLGPAVPFWALVPALASLAFEHTRAFPPPALAFRKLLAALFYIYNVSEAWEPTTIGHLYSLSTEMQFYLAFPFVLAFVRGPSRRLGLLGGILALGVFGCPGFDTNGVFRFGGIVAGMALHLLRRANRLPDLPISPRVAAAFSPALLALLFTCGLPLAANQSLASHAADVVAFALVWAASRERGFIVALGVPRAMDWIGTRSYSIYLCHIPLMLIARSLLFEYKTVDGAVLAAPMVPGAAVLAIWLAATVLASEITYKTLERPFQRKAHALAARYLASAMHRQKLTTGTLGRA